jgi:hypothetical protein
MEVHVVTVILRRVRGCWDWFEASWSEAGRVPRRSGDTHQQGLEAWGERRSAGPGLDVVSEPEEVQRGKAKPNWRAGMNR